MTSGSKAAVTSVTELFEFGPLHQLARAFGMLAVGARRTDFDLRLVVRPQAEQPAEALAGLIQS